LGEETVAGGGARQWDRQACGPTRVRKRGGEERGGLGESGDRKEERRHALRGNDSIIFSIAHALDFYF
jgi:hypothetical protein